MDQQTKELIENNINTNEVCLFMKGTPDAPECGFSMAVANMLKIFRKSGKLPDLRTIFNIFAKLILALKFNI